MVRVYMYIAWKCPYINTVVIKLNSIKISDGALVTYLYNDMTGEIDLFAYADIQVYAPPTIQWLFI